MVEKTTTTSWFPLTNSLPITSYDFWKNKNIGKSIERDPSIDRLIEIRTVLEKIRPIDYKLRYQIDKLVKTAITGVTNSKDPINFKVWKWI